MEIYIENATTASLVEWLEKSYRVDSLLIADDYDIIRIIYGDITIPVIVTSGINGTHFTGVWFNSEKLPWYTLEELVKFAASNYKSRIRYEKPDLSPVFYELFNGQITSITC